MQISNSESVSRKENIISDLINHDIIVYPSIDVAYTPDTSVTTTSMSSKNGKNGATGFNILLVDDSDMIRKVVSKKLIRAGHLVELAQNGAVALNKVMNGYNDTSAKEGLLEKMEEDNSSIHAEGNKKDSCNNNRCSGNIYASLNDSQSVPGMDALLEKPFDLKKFDELMKKLLHKNSKK
eukprot:gene15894-21550_t